MAKYIGYIYKTTNLINGKIYIGQHQRDSFDKHYYGSGKILQFALDKYGKDNFSVEVIYWAKSVNRLNTAEILFIDAFDSKNRRVGYNINNGGISGRKGCKMPKLAKIKIGLASKGNKYRCGKVPWNKGKRGIYSVESLEKMRAASKGRKASEAEIERNRLSHLGKRHTEESKRKMSLRAIGKPGTRIGRITSEETRRKQSESNKGKHFRPMSDHAKNKLSSYWKGKSWPRARREAYERSKIKLVENVS